MMTEATPAALSSAREQRADLWKHMTALEHALSHPLPGRVDAWGSDVHDALVDLSSGFEHHCAAVEAPDGLFASVLEAAPRLDHAVRRLADEHIEISALISTLLREVRTLAREGTEDEGVAVRARITELLGRLSQHRQRAADLVYEAYAVDIGVGD
ncbi:MAG: hypothetical protein ACQETV_03495 [Actinomycetota bacterium]